MDCDCINARTEYVGECRETGSPLVACLCCEGREACDVHRFECDEDGAVLAVEMAEALPWDAEAEGVAF